MTAPPRRWFRWSLRTLFVVMTPVACWLGWLAFRNETRHPDTGYAFPAAMDIVSMQAVEFWSSELPEPQSFEVPKHCWEDVLDAVAVRTGHHATQNGSVRKIETHGYEQAGRCRAL